MNDDSILLAAVEAVMERKQSITGEVTAEAAARYLVEEAKARGVTTQEMADQGLRALTIGTGLDKDELQEAAQVMSTAYIDEMSITTPLGFKVLAMDPEQLQQMGSALWIEGVLVGVLFAEKFDAAVRRAAEAD